MGLDLALGGVVLLMALRGWWKGFVLQAIHLVGLVACVYAADPVRDVVQRYAREYLPTIGPDLLDRLLWWSSAVACYVVMVGVAKLLVGSFRRKSYFEPELNRNDQLAGLLLGAVKGLVAAAFLAAGVEKYALGYVKDLPWAGEQAKDSVALAWNKEYQPAPRVWAAPPVQHYVAHIRRMGLQGPHQDGARPMAAEPSEKFAGATSVPTASRPPKLALPPDGPAGLPAEVARAVEALKDELRTLEPGN